MSQIAAIAENYYRIRYTIFKKRYDLAITQKLALAFGMAIATGLMAQVRIPLGFTPVPITGQSFMVLLAGVLLGRNWGGISMIFYAFLGAAGLPLFSGWSGGLAVIAGPTGGYIFGFILAALFIGYISDKFIKSRNFFPMFFLMLFSVLFLILLPGLIYLGIWMGMINGSSVTVSQLFAIGLVPFIPGALVKVSAAALAAKIITPKKSFDE